MSRVVIADDHSFFRAGLESVLKRNGFDVVASVGDGESALTAIHDLSPDIAILDVRMPEKTGIETLEALRKEGQDCTVILLAAEFEDEALVGAINAGANAIVNKSNSDRSLLDALAAVQSGGQYLEHGYLDRFLKLGNQPARQGSPAVQSLSERERLIAEGVAKGLKNREIASELGLSEAMVKLYLHRLYGRLDLKSRTDLAIFMSSLAN